MIMISMPMNYSGWIKDYQKKKNELEEKGYKVSPLHINEIYNSLPEYQFKVQNTPLMFMSNSFARMAISNAVYFCKGWETARGCRLEHQAAQDYGLYIIYEE